MGDIRQHSRAPLARRGCGRLSSLAGGLALVALSLGACAETPGGTAPPESGAASGTPAETHEMLNAVLWQTSSAEYEAVVRQSFRMARMSLDRAMADPSWSAALEQTGAFAGLPPALILDLDETVLDNTPYEDRIIRVEGEFTREGFRKWCEEAKAAATPGAQEFLRYADRQGVAVFYVSARAEAERSCTLRNLKRLGLPLRQGSDQVLLRAKDGKSGHRRRVAARYRVVLLVGDSLEDFVAGSKAAPDQRRLLARAHADRWGRQWIMLPNPMYGHWEATFYDFDYSLPRADKLKKKYRGLKATGTR